MYRGTKIPQAAWCGQSKKKRKEGGVCLWAPQYGGDFWSPSGLLGNPRPDPNSLGLHPGKMVSSHWKMLPSSAEQQGWPGDHRQSLQHGGPSCLGPSYRKCGKCHWRQGIRARGVLTKRLSDLRTQSDFSAEPNQHIHCVYTVYQRKQLAQLEVWGAGLHVPLAWPRPLPHSKGGEWSPPSPTDLRGRS